MFSVPDESVSGCIPATGFVRSYVEWAYRQCDAPAVFHLGVGLALLAAVAAPDLGFVGGGGVTHPNLYILCVGTSGSARKSWAIEKLGSAILHDVAPERKQIHPASYPALLEQIAESPTQVIVDDDLARFLRDAKGQGYLSGVKQGYLTLFDCPPNLRIPRRSGGQAGNIIASPRLNMLAGANLTELSDFLDRGDLSSGFLSRWIILMGRRRRSLPFDGPKSPPEARAYLVETLGSYLRLGPTGHVPFDPHASETINKWEAKLDEDILTSHNEEHISLLSRLPTIARKTALLYALDRVLHAQIAGKRTPTHITATDVAPALRLAEAAHQSTLAMHAALYVSNDMRDRAKVLSAVPRDRAIPIGMITEPTRLLRGRVAMILDTLKEEGWIQEVAGDRGVTYRRARYLDGEGPVPINVDGPSQANQTPAVVRELTFEERVASQSAGAWEAASELDDWVTVEDD